MVKKFFLLSCHLRIFFSFVKKGNIYCPSPPLSSHFFFIFTSFLFMILSSSSFLFLHLFFHENISHNSQLISLQNKNCLLLISAFCSFFILSVIPLTFSFFFLFFFLLLMPPHLFTHLKLSIFLQLLCNFHTFFFTLV